MMMLRKQRSDSYTMHSYRILIAKALLLVCLLGIISTCFAEGSDLLDGTGGDLIATLMGSRFKMFVYIGEGLLSLIAFIKTKNPLILFGIIVVAFFFNLILHVSGVSA
jgi:hypothetical protein